MFKEDIEKAKLARLFAVCPYSNFEVGVCLRTKSGKLYTGCNIENHGIQSICGERTAFVKALSEGEKEFESIVIVGARKGEDIKEECMPCGYCRQFMSEFVDGDFKIYTIGKNSINEYKIKDLLPFAFRTK